MPKSTDYSATEREQAAFDSLMSIDGMPYKKAAILATRWVHGKQTGLSSQYDMHYLNEAVEYASSKLNVPIDNDMTATQMAELFVPYIRECYAGKPPSEPRPPRFSVSDLEQALRVKYPEYLSLIKQGVDIANVSRYGSQRIVEDQVISRFYDALASTIYTVLSIRSLTVACAEDVVNGIEYMTPQHGVNMRNIRYYNYCGDGAPLYTVARLIRKSTNQYLKELYEYQ